MFQFQSGWQIAAFPFNMIWVIVCSIIFYIIYYNLQNIVLGVMLMIIMGISANTETMKEVARRRLVHKKPLN